jgi:hypothetical protein
MVEPMANSVENYLIDGLSFKLNPSASYVQDRRSVSYFVAGSNIYQPGSGARVARINISGDSWLDPSTVRVIYTLTNNDTNVNHILRPVSGPWSFFRRARCLNSGTILDDVDYYNRCHEMLHILTSKNNLENDEVEGFGNVRWDDDYAYGKWDTTNTAVIPGGANGVGSRTVSFKPLFGILNQPKYIPLMWCPLTFEFEIVNGNTDAIVNIDGTTFTSSNTSTSWQISDIRVVADIVTLDNSLQNEYANYVLEGKGLRINYGTYITQFQTIANTSNIVANISRSASRLKTVFITFDNDHSTVVAGDESSVVHRQFNTFVNPMAGTNYIPGSYDFAKELQIQVQLGAKLFPEFGVRSLAECFYQLKKSLGIHGSAYHSVDINSIKYRTDHFIVGIDTEKVLDASFTGYNSRMGDLMVIRCKGANSDIATWCNAMYVVLHTDQILEIRDVGSLIYD